MFMMAALYAFCRDNNYPLFVQDEKYFKKYEREIRELYSVGIPPTQNRVSIHVRRAKNPIDPNEPAYHENSFYVDLGHHLHEDMSDNYYVRAMALFPDEEFIVFSDDIDWCKKQPMFKDCLFAHGTELEDLNQMASCKSNIIANSSFSWWAAFLNKNPDKIVIAPKQWFADINNEHLIGIPKKWIRI